MELNQILLRQTANRFVELGYDQQMLSELYNIKPETANAIMQAILTPKEITVYKEMLGRDNY